MRLKNVKRPKPAQLNMTSMIDVIFLLLIFFVCTANLNAVEEILPTQFSFSGANVSLIEPDPNFIDLKYARIRISYEKRVPHWQVEGQSCRTVQDVQDLLARIARTKPDLPVIIACDPVVPWGNVIDTYDICRSVGLQKIQYEVTTTQ